MTEANQLVALAQSFGLGREAVLELHQDYLKALGCVAREDCVITDDERADLLAVASRET